MKKKLLSLSVLIAMLWGCCNVEDTPKTDEKPANYIVTFDANGGKGTMPQQIFVADTPQPLNQNTFKRDGYVFTEWNTTADGKGVTYLSGSYYSLTSDIKLYAQWNAEEEKKEDEENPDNPEQTYSVTYKSQYGTVPSKISGLKKDDELTILQLQELVATGYTFAGWYNGENEITTGHKITCDLELTAKWDVNTYTVVFYDNGGDGNMEYQNFTYNAEQALNANAFTREGYTFAGWAASDDGKVIYADKGKVKNLTAENGAIVALYAVWTDNDKVLPVIFSQPTAVDYGESVTLSCATEGAKISYTIDGVTAEYTDAFPITKDVIITAFATKDGMKDSDTSIASYTVKTYRVTYRSEYGTEPDKIMGLKKGDTLTEEQLAGITAGGYTFAGWYNGENKIEAGYTITCDLELTAKWDANTDTGYTVEHYQQNANDDEYTLAETENQTGATGENTFATAKTYAGFTVKSVEQTKNAENGSTVVKIYYDRNIITLTLNLDGGEGQTEIKGKYGADVTTPANPAKDGYDFGGWNPELPATFPLKNTEYTAIWWKLCTITYNLASGSWKEGFTPITIRNENTCVTLPTADDIERADYDFMGWYDEKGKKVTEIAIGTAEDVVLNAKWKEGAIGDIVYSDGSISENYDSTKKPIGIVIEVSDEGLATKIVSLAMTEAAWSTEKVSTNARSTTDGKANMEAIQAIEGWETKYPAFKWCDDYTDDSGNSEWYLPARNELKQLYLVKDYVNATIEKIRTGGGTATKFFDSFYWSSSEYSSIDAWVLKTYDGTFHSYNDGNGYFGAKYNKVIDVRPIRAF